MPWKCCKFSTDYAVRISGLPFVMTTVCSKCAVRLPSLVPTVQPSAPVTARLRLTETIGSTARTKPSVSFVRWVLGVVEVEHGRLLVNCAPQAVTRQLTNDVKPTALDLFLHRAPNDVDGLAYFGNL